ncbi:MAG: hypothetical protein ABIH50_05050 [bacterium]
MGTRPMGMGGAFTAIADDANAPYWNPAGLALNPEVSLTGSTMANNKNIWVGDNLMNMKFCYETEMNPFQWILGIGLASAVALESAQYLSDQGIVKKNWGRGGEAPSRDESVTGQVTASGEAVSLRQGLKDTIKKLASATATKTKETAKSIVKNTNINVNVGVGLVPWSSPWYHRDYDRPHYWEQSPAREGSKAQFALGLSWLGDYNATPSIDQKTNWYTVSIASGFAQRIAVGAGLNFYDLTKISTNVRGMGADLDVGVIAKPVEYISVGLVTKGVLTTDFNWQNGQKTRGYEMLVNTGIAVKPIYSLTLAADAQNIFNQNGKQATMHYGAEAVLMPGLLARAGLSDGSKTAGLSLAVGNLIIDYAILGGSFNRTQMVGGTWRF